MTGPDLHRKQRLYGFPRMIKTGRVKQERFAAASLSLAEEARGHHCGFRRATRHPGVRWRFQSGGSFTRRSSSIRPPKDADGCGASTRHLTEKADDI